jgi:hypothetical protein
MTQINSPFLLSRIRPTAEFAPDSNEYFYQMERILQQLYQGSEDMRAQIDALSARVSELESELEGGL